MTARDFFNYHKTLFSNWEHGDIKEVWQDNSHTICIQYADDAWWHYSIDDNNNIIFWQQKARLSS